MTRHTVVMVTTSYPRFPGDTVGTFMEPIARGVAARGHNVHVVAPWHPLIKRASDENGIHFHFFRFCLFTMEQKFFNGFTASRFFL
ncbi:MAG: hypothetical protein CMP01_05650 [Woeseiaceae bacterium]|nr:hypothetical protein [Woeseiaceae bacterium]